MRSKFYVLDTCKCVGIYDGFEYRYHFNSVDTFYSRWFINYSAFNTAVKFRRRVVRSQDILLLAAQFNRGHPNCRNIPSPFRCQSDWLMISYNPLKTIYSPHCAIPPLSLHCLDANNWDINSMQMPSALFSAFFSIWLNAYAPLPPHMPHHFAMALALWLIFMIERLPWAIMFSMINLNACMIKKVFVVKHQTQKFLSTSVALATCRLPFLL